MEQHNHVAGLNNEITGLLQGAPLPPQMQLLPMNDANLVDIRDHINVNNVNLDTSRTNYITAKRNARSWWNNNGIRNLFRRVRHQPTPDQQMENARTIYEQNRNQYIQLEARVRTDAPFEHVQFPDNQQQRQALENTYRSSLANNYAGLLVDELRRFTRDEVESRTGRERMLSWLHRHPLLRAAVGYGIDAGIIVSGVTGNIPVTLALYGAKTAAGAVETEGLLHAIQRTYSQTAGERRSRRQADINTMTLAEVHHALASLAEERILDGQEGQSLTEERLLVRLRELVRQQINGRLTTDQVDPWQLHRQYARTRAGNIHTRHEAVQNALNTIPEHQQDYTNAEQQLTQERAAYDAANNERQQHEQTYTTALNTRTMHEQRRQDRQQEFNGADHYFNDTHAPNNPGLIINAPANRTRVEEACRIHIEADDFLANPANQNNPNGIHQATLNRNHARRVLNDNGIVHLGAANRDTLLNNYRLRRTAQTRIDQENNEINQQNNIIQQEQQEIQARITAMDTAQQNMRARENEMNAAQQAIIAAQQQLTNFQDPNNPITLWIAETHQLNDELTTIRNRANQIYSIFMNNGSLELANINSQEQLSLAYERGWRRNRWLLAITASAIANAFFLPGHPFDLNLKWPSWHKTHAAKAASPAKPQPVSPAPVETPPVVTPPTPAPVPVTPQPWTSYSVHPGDTLWSILQNNGINPVTQLGSIETHNAATLATTAGQHGDFFHQLPSLAKVVHGGSSLPDQIRAGWGIWPGELIELPATA